MKSLLAGLVVSLVLLGPASADEPVVRLCADQWMPYNGEPAAAKPGYVIELARTVFEPQGVKVEYNVMPWEEALGAVREGRMSGAIGANAEEAEGLTCPPESIGSISICLIVRAETAWAYDNIASFRKVTLGIIKGYSYWPALDAYIEKPDGKGLCIAEGDTPLEDLMTKLQAGEIDVVAESEPVLLWYLRSHSLDREKFRVVFKGTPEPIFVAFSSSDEGRRYATMLGEGIRALRASGELTKLLQRYGLRDWQ